MGRQHAGLLWNRSHRETAEIVESGRRVEVVRDASYSGQQLQMQSGVVLVAGTAEALVDSTWPVVGFGTAEAMVDSTAMKAAVVVEGIAVAAAVLDHSHQLVGAAVLVSTFAAAPVLVGASAAPVLVGISAALVLVGASAAPVLVSTFAVVADVGTFAAVDASAAELVQIHSIPDFAADYALGAVRQWAFHTGGCRKHLHRKTHFVGMLGP